MTPSRPSHTAEAVCLMRAIDREGPGAPRVVDDPYARWFLSAPFRVPLHALSQGDARLGLRPQILPRLSRYVQARHRWMDDHLVSALSGGALSEEVAQVLILGAGYDMRAYRFAREIGQRPVFEVDYPSTGARKAAILDAHREELPAVDLRQVPIDFNTQRLPDVLAAAGFREDLPTFVTWEGVSMYLDREAVAGTLSTLRALGAVHLVMDFWSDATGEGLVAAFHRFAPALLHFIAEPVTFTVAPSAVSALLGESGWGTEEVVTGDELGTLYGIEGKVYPGVYVVSARATGR